MTFNMTANPLTVTQVNSYIKQLLEGDRNMRNIFVCGEISNYRRNYSSGHAYFNLKDGGSVIHAVMYSNNARRLRFEPADGLRVIIMGRVSVYDKNGEYQLVIESMQQDGVGQMSLAYEQLRSKLEAQGVFDGKRKRPIPPLPRRIGVVTSPTGAVIQDIKNVAERRCPLAEIVLYPSAVQGENAAEQLTNGIRTFNKRGDVDVIIIGRGGGSFEDLNCFNNETLIWAIYDSTIPIISAVGHETDVTLCDFAADRRAPTPSAAAELAVPDKNVLMSDLSQLLGKISVSVGDKLNTAYQDIDRLKDIISSLQPETHIKAELETLGQLNARINNSTENRLVLEKAQIDALANSVNALSPISLLQKGYSVTSKEGKCISSVSNLTQGDRVNIRFADGSADCIVDNIKIGG